jgi:hypothetical protein
MPENSLSLHPDLATEELLERLREHAAAHGLTLEEPPLAPQPALPGARTPGESHRALLVLVGALLEHLHSLQDNFALLAESDRELRGRVAALEAELAETRRPAD